MTEKPKKQLSNLNLLITVAILPLAVLYVVVIAVDPSHLFIIAAGLFFTILFLIPLRNRLNKSRSIAYLDIQNITEKKNLIEADINRQEMIIGSFQEKIISYSHLKGLTERLGSCLNLDETSKTLSSEVNSLFGDDQTTIILYLFHSKTGKLGITSSHKGRLRVNLKSKQGDEFDLWTARTMLPLFIADIKTDYRFDIDKIKTEEGHMVRSLISVPMISGNKAIGILRIDSPSETRFSTEDLRLLTTIGDLGAVAIENAQLYERVEQLAIKDSLTGLYLRQYVMDRLSSEISRHLRRKKDLSLLMIDLDHFKEYNDKFGHMAGDIVLKTVGKVMAKVFDQPGNMVCRYGGEEFAVVLTECSKKEAQELAEEFRRKIESKDIMLRRKKSNITVSVGTATFPKDAHNHKELIHFADMALYKAKEEGRNKVIST